MQKWEELVYAKEEGITEGKAQGIEEGKKLYLIKVIGKKLANSKSPETIAEELEEDLSVVMEICKVAEEYAPDYDCGCIYEALNKTKDFALFDS